MAILKCKMCGGDLNLMDGGSTAECEFCGTLQTVPNVDNEKKLNLFARANRLRAACEFDKASGVYESIVGEFPEEAEAYWGLILCKYGIEYVDDPATGKKIPTCHRSSFDGVMDDSNFELVMENADPAARKIYREEAKTIEELRKGIVEVSAKEAPYDIFICYKETAPDGQRTLDSVLAQDIYDALTEKGYRVFFSRVTLEDKLGQEYEPYIFAALQSAKIMLVVGTDYEYYNAVWVKNEWSRFLQLMTSGQKKYLIPCFKGIDAYDMPKEFAKLQAQDLGKVGAMQDLLRGVEKLVGVQNEGPKTAPIAISASPENALIDRGYLYMDDKEFNKANEYFEKALDVAPQAWRAYLGKVLSRHSCATLAELEAYVEKHSCDIDNDKNFIRAIEFSPQKEKQQLLSIVELVKEKRLEKVYLKASDLLSQKEYHRAEELFLQIPDFRDSAALVQKCNEEEAKHIEHLAAIRNNLKKAQEVLLLGGVESDVVGYDDCLSHRSVKLTEDGTVIASGHNEYGECNVQNWRDIIAVARGEDHTVGLKKDGTVLAVGDNRKGQCNVGDWTNIVAIYAQDCYTAGLKADGTVVVVGYIDGDYLIRNWRDVVLLRGGSHSLTCLRADGSVATTASYDGDLKDFNDIVDVYTEFHTIGLRANGTVVAAMPSHYKAKIDDPWRALLRDERERACQVDEWEDIVAIACGPKITVGLKSDGTVVYAGAYSCDISQWKDIVAINIKDNNTVRGLRKDGHVCHVNYYYNCPKTSVSTNKMFENFDTLEQEIQEARQKRAEEKRLKLEEEKKKTERRQAGKCQHCGGEFKGLFTKKCANCGNPRDY